MKFSTPADVIRRRRALADLLADNPDAPRGRRRLDKIADVSGMPITVMAIEVEYFGDLTRREKRALCEDVIRRIELKLPNLLRASDVTYREGRARVCVLLPDTSSEDAQIVEARVRRSLDFELLPTKATVAIALSSAGESTPVD